VREKGGKVKREGVGGKGRREEEAGGNTSEVDGLVVGCRR